MSFVNIVAVLLFAYWVILHALCRLLIFFFFRIQIFSKSSFKNNTTRVSNSLDPDQARRLSGLILVQTVCKCYQQTILVGKKLTIPRECYVLPGDPSNRLDVDCGEYPTGTRIRFALFIACH